MIIRSALRLLLGATLGLPLLQMLLFWVARLLTAMGDDAAASVVGRLMIGNGMIWLMALVAMIVLLALRAIEEHELDDA